MKKIYQIGIEVEVEEVDEQRAICAARDHYRASGGAEELIDDNSDLCRSVSPEEFVPDAIGAVMELIAGNDLLEAAGIHVIEVSCQS